MFSSIIEFLLARFIWSGLCQSQSQILSLIDLYSHIFTLHSPIYFFPFYYTLWTSKFKVDLTWISANYIILSVLSTQCSSIFIKLVCQWTSTIFEYYVQPALRYSLVQSAVAMIECFNLTLSECYSTYIHAFWWWKSNILMQLQLLVHLAELMTISSQSRLTLNWFYVQ